MTQAKKSDCVPVQRRLILNGEQEIGEAMTFHTALSLVDAGTRPLSHSQSNFFIAMYFSKNCPKHKTKGWCPIPSAVASPTPTPPNTAPSGKFWPDSSLVIVTFSHTWRPSKRRQLITWWTCLAAPCVKPCWSLAFYHVWRHVDYVEQEFILFLWPWQSHSLMEHQRRIILWRYWIRFKLDKFN